MTSGSVRRAEPADVSRIEEIVRAAYAPWVEQLGVRPRPLSADYADLVANGHVHVTAVTGVPPAGGADGLIVLSPGDGLLVVENLAVAPDKQGAWLGRRLLGFAEHSRQPIGVGSLVHLHKPVG